MSFASGRLSTGWDLLFGPWPVTVLLVLSFVSARKVARWFEFKSRKGEEIFYFKMLSNYYFVLADQVAVSGTDSGTGPADLVLVPTIT